MSLSHPVKFPLLKLPWLCTKCVLHNLDEFVIKCFESWIGPYLQSCTTGDTLVALKMGVEFMIDAFGCAIETVFVDGNKPSEFLRLGISSVKKLFINSEQVKTAGLPKKVNIKELKYLLENVKVTDRCVFNAPIPEDFYCDPQIFKCRGLSFGPNRSADWVTVKLLCQFNVPQLTFFSHRFSVEDIVSYVTHWFNSENRKLEYLYVSFDDPVSFEDFKIDHLNPMPFCEKRRSKRPFVEGWKNTDMSSGKDILRQDGLLATFFVKSTSVLFYIWHKRFPDDI